MTTIKFDKSVKYQGVRYAAHEAFKVEDSDVNELKKAGATVLATDVKTPEPSQEPENPNEEQDEDQKQDGAAVPTAEELLNYTVAELTAFAEEHDIDLQGKTRKADIYNIIVTAIK